MTVPRAWIPNRARFVPLFAYSGNAPRGHLPTLLPRRWPAKRPTDQLDYGLDCREYVARTGDAIASFTLAIVPDDLKALLVCQVGALLIAWLGGGSDGVDYTAIWSIRFVSGQDIVASVSVGLSAGPGLAAPTPKLTPLAVRPDRAAEVLARDGTPILPANGTLSAAATTTVGVALEVEAGGVLVFHF